MRIVFFGTPSFAATILKTIFERGTDEVVAVVTKKDAPSGRFLHAHSSPVKQCTEQFSSGIPIYTFETVSSEESIAILKACNADLFYVVGYGEILRQTVLDIPRFGAVNVHASMLPLYRGAAPIQRALLDGCSTTGVTIFRLTKGMDCGDIIWQKSCSIDDDMNCSMLSERLEELSKEGTATVLDAFACDKVHFVPQRHEEATLASKIHSEEYLLDPLDDIVALHNRIRAFSPPGAYFSIRYRDKTMRLKVLRSSLLPVSFSPLRAFCQFPDNTFGITTPSGSIVFELVQMEGKQAMPSEIFLRGVPLSEIHFLPKEKV